MENEQMQQAVSKEFRSYCIEKYPNLLKKKSYRRLFQYLCFTSHYSADTHRELLPHSILQDMNDVSRDDKNWRSGSFLSEFKKEVLHDFAWSEYEWRTIGWAGNVREVINNGFQNDEKLLELLSLEVEPFGSVKEVLFVSGRVWNANMKKFVNYQRLKSLASENVLPFARLIPSTSF